jgi:hypothetical protein
MLQLGDTDRGPYRGPNAEARSPVRAVSAARAMTAAFTAATTSSNPSAVVGATISYGSTGSTAAAVPPLGSAAHDVLLGVAAGRAPTLVTTSNLPLLVIS